MRVLHVYKDYYPVVGGIEVHIKTLCTALNQEKGVEASVLVTSPNRRTVREVVEGVPVTKVGRFAKVASAPLSVGLFREIGRQTYDIAHLHFPYPIGEMAYLLRGRPGKLVISYHSDIVRQKNLLRVYTPFLWRILGRADRIVVTSPAYAETSPFLARFREKCAVVPYGIDLNRFRNTKERKNRAAAIRAQYSPDGTPLVLFVGLLRYYKGVEYLVEAMQDVPAKLLILGEGPLEAELKRQAEQLGVRSKVAFLGRFPNEQIAAIYRACDLFVLPSIFRSEAFGIVQLEAMACGLPVVSTELGTGTSYANQHGETGLVVPPRDAKALAGAINTILSDANLKREMGQRGQGRVKKEFSAPVMVKRVLGIYQELLSGA